MAVNGGIATTTNRIHLPRREIVVHDMDVASPTPRHPLNKPLSEMIKRNRHLHPRIRRVAIVVAQQHHLVVVREVIVRYRYRRRAQHGVDKPVGAMAHGAMVDPDLLRSENGDPVSVGSASFSGFRRGSSYNGASGRFAVVDVDVVDDDVLHVLDS